MIPQALKGLLASEKAFAGGVLIIAATAFVFTGWMTIEHWQEFAKWIFGIYAAGKTATSIATTMKGNGLGPGTDSTDANPNSSTDTNAVDPTKS